MKFVNGAAFQRGKRMQGRKKEKALCRETSTWKVLSKQRNRALLKQRESLSTENKGWVWLTGVSLGGRLLGLQRSPQGVPCWEHSRQQLQELKGVNGPSQGSVPLDTAEFLGEVSYGILFYNSNLTAEPGTLLCTAHALPHLTLPIIVWGVCSYYLNFIEEETKGRRD